MAHRRDVPDPPSRARGAFTGRAEELAALAAWHRGGGVACVRLRRGGRRQDAARPEFAGRHGGACSSRWGGVARVARRVARGGVGVEPRRPTCSPATSVRVLDARGEALVVLDARRVRAAIGLRALWDRSRAASPLVCWPASRSCAPGLAGELVVEVGPSPTTTPAPFAPRVEERREALTAHDLRAPCVARLPGPRPRDRAAAARGPPRRRRASAARFAWERRAFDGAPPRVVGRPRPEERRAPRAVALPRAGDGGGRGASSRRRATLPRPAPSARRAELANVRVSPDGARLP